MTINAFAQAYDWEPFNSSLLIEVTRPNGVFTCTGVVVSSHTIVTAAHCLDGEIKSVKVFTQASYDPKAPFLAISTFKIHPNYNPQNSRYRSDLAKITMKEKIPSFIRIHPIHQQSLVIGNVYRFGFGQRNKKNVRTVITPTIRRYVPAEEVLELNDEYSMSGDSGGPIFVQNGDKISIVAVHSTFSHGPEGNFSLNPLLSTHIPWIFAH